MYILSQASLERMYQIKLSGIYTFECPILDMARLQFLFCEPQVKKLDGVFRLEAHPESPINSGSLRGDVRRTTMKRPNPSEFRHL